MDSFFCQSFSPTSVFLSQNLNLPERDSGPNANKMKIYEEQQQAIDELGRTRSETKTDKKADSVKMKPTGSTKISPIAQEHGDLEESAF